MKRLAYLLCPALLVLLSAAVARAETISLFNTGVDDQRALLPGGAIDPHYQLISSPDPNFPGPTVSVASDVYPVDGPWLVNGPDSKWIAPQAEVDSGNSDGFYTYRTTFDLTGLNPVSAVISGRWTMDDYGIDILINGVGTGITYPDNGALLAFSPLFSVASGFVSGVNTLDFVLNNFPFDGPNPTGLRVELSGTANSIAEPSSFALAALGAATLMILRRSRRSGICLTVVENCWAKHVRQMPDLPVLSCYSASGVSF